MYAPCWVPCIIFAGTHTTIKYNEFNGKIEKLCEWFCIAMFGTIAFYTIPLLIFAIVNYYVFDLADESFYLIFPTMYVLSGLQRLNDLKRNYFTHFGHLRMLPFDWKTPLGYAVASLAEAVAFSAVCVGVIPVLSLVFASSWLFIIIADDDITHKLAAFSNDVQISHEHYQEELMRRRFCDIIQLYSNAKQ